MSLIVEPETTRDELAEAIASVNALAKRTPAHFTVEWAKWHRELDNLLDKWQTAS